MGTSSDAALTPGPLSVPEPTERTRREPAIEVADVEKTFRIPRHRPSTLKERVLHPLRTLPEQTIPGARSLSFSVEKGEFFGIVGRNGSGKSTVLKMLAGIYTPDSGKVRVQGRISPFIELGVGFNHELAARDNVIVNGAMLGLSRREIARRYPEIIDFAELEQYADLRLKNYSSGMLVRLAFATAIQVDADVLLLDEVLAVGDAGFQQKCFDAFRRMHREGVTIVLVTHNMEVVRRFCDRAMLLEEGSMVELGDPEEVAERYREISSSETHATQPGHSEPGHYGDGSATCLDAWVEDSRGLRQEVVEQGERIVLCAEFEFPGGYERPTCGIQIRGEQGFDVFAMNTLWAAVSTPTFGPGERAVLRISIENHLGVGTYTLTPGAANRDGTRLADLRMDFTSFRVDGKRWTGAAADLPFELQIDREAPR